MVKPCIQKGGNIKTQYILNKNAPLTPNSWDFYDLRNIVAKFCRENLRTFSADLFGLKNRIPQTLSFFGCMLMADIERDL